MIPRLYKPVSLSLGATIALDETERHYLQRVMRLTVGQSVILFNGDDHEWHCQIVHGGPPMRLLLQESHLVQRESLLSITLVQGLAKSQSLEWVIQKGVELGMSSMIPLISQRSRHDGGNQERWARIAAEAAEQCGRTRVPTIHAATPWNKLSPLLEEGPRLLFWEEERGGNTLSKVFATTSKPSHITLLIGPEGGFAQEEVILACQQLGCQRVGLGPRILRTETAALAALAALQLMWGDLA